MILEDGYVFVKEKFVYRNIPDFLRFPRRIDWLMSLITPIETNVAVINEYRQRKLIELSYNGQTILLEKVLNDLFDPIERRITIIHETTENVFIFFDADVQPQEIWTYFDTENATEADTTFLYFTAEQPGIDLPNDIDFRIVCPIELISYEDQIIAVVDKYKIAGKRFDVIFV